MDDNYEVLKVDKFLYFVTLVLVVARMVLVKG
jgi:hypothetical protein